MSKTLRVKDLQDFFNFRRVTGNDEALERLITEPNTNRPGLELSGYLDGGVTKRVVIIGEKEARYINTLDRDRQGRVFDYLTQPEIPCIVISRDLPCPQILYDIAQYKNFPIFSSYAPTNNIIVEIMNFMEEYFVEVQSVHGVFLQVYGRGVLIRAESGLGKSEIAFELIKRGHIFVSDDRVDIFRMHNDIYGQVPDILRNLLELRGIGIVDVVAMFGISSVVERARIDYVLDLKRWSDDAEYDRINVDKQRTETFFGVELPLIEIPVSEGRSTAVLIEAAITNQILRSRGINSSQELEDRVLEEIARNKGVQQ